MTARAPQARVERLRIALELAGLCFGCQSRPVVEAGERWCTRQGCADALRERTLRLRRDARGRLLAAGATA